MAKLPKNRYVFDEGDSPKTIAKLIDELHDLLKRAPRASLPKDLREVLNKCLLITGSFEGDGYSSLSGDFDEQGMSIGILQWCLGQGSLQPLLEEYIHDNSDKLVEMWGKDKAEEFISAMNGGRGTQMSWARNVLGESERPKGAWANRLRQMAGSPEFVAIQQKYSRGVFDRALSLASEFNLKQENAIALMFDIVTQNGGIAYKHHAKIQDYVNEMKQALKVRTLTEDQYLVCISRGRAYFSITKWQIDVVSRKLCIAHKKSEPFSWAGSNYSGKVHGEMRDLEKEYELTSEKILP